MNELWFFIPCIIYLGLITSYTDIKYGKIKNRDVIIGIAYALAVYFGLAIYAGFAGMLNYSYFIEFGANAVFALIVAFGLWNYKIWSAGDGKLFFAFAMLVPLGVYIYGNYKWVYSLTLLLNVFVIGLFAMLFLVIKNIKINNFKKILKSFFNFFKPKNFFQSLISLFATFWAVQLMLSTLGFSENRPLMYISTVATFSLLPKISKILLNNKKFNKTLKTALPISIALLRLFIDHSIYTLNFLVDFVALFLLWRLSINLINENAKSIGKDLFSRQVRIRDLKVGMIPSNPILKTKKLTTSKAKFLAKEGANVITKGGFSYVEGTGKIPGQPFIILESEGLEKQHIALIKKTGFKNIGVSTTVPFSPFMFLGVLLTILAKGNILILIRFIF